MTCDACGRSMELSSGANVVGVNIELNWKDSDEISREEFAEFFSPYEIGKNYNVCFPCWMKSLGIKP